MSVALVAILVLLFSSAPAGAAYRTVPIWAPQHVQQLHAYRIEIVVTHKVSKQVTTLTYHESFADAALAASHLPLVKTLFFEWLEANYGMSEAELHEEFDLDVRVRSMPGSSVTRRAA